MNFNLNFHALFWPDKNFHVLFCSVFWAKNYLGVLEHVFCVLSSLVRRVIRLSQVINYHKLRFFHKELSVFYLFGSETT